MPVDAVVRAGRPEDAAAAVDVFIDTLTDLYARMSTPAPAFPVDATVAAYRHIAETGFLRIAEADGAAIAVACGIVRGHVSFLSGFWTRPAHQGRGIGGKILAAAEADARRLGATTFATWSSLDVGAVAVYLRHGMLPGFPAITLAGRLPTSLVAPAGLELVSLEPEVAAAVDEVVAFPARLVDHEHWLRDPGGHRGWEVRRAGQRLGYVQVDGDRLGPAGWLRPEFAADVLAVGASELARGSGDARLSVPGSNHDALRYGLGLGLRVAGYGTFLTTEPFGRLEQYVASGPLLF